MNIFAMAISVSGLESQWNHVVWIDESSPQVQTKHIKDLGKILYGGIV
jgi:hypothetical protein